MMYPVSTLTVKNRPLLFGTCLAAAATFALTACATDTPVAQSPTTPSIVISNTAAPAPAPTTASPTAAPDGCPVDAATLEKAFKANADLAANVILGGGLVRITCYQGYAVAHTTPTEVDSALVLFIYNASTATWSAVTAGTAVPCGDFVPAAVVPHLPGCAQM